MIKLKEDYKIDKTLSLHLKLNLKHQLLASKLTLKRIKIQNLRDSFFSKMKFALIVVFASLACFASTGNKIIFLTKNFYY
jgi:hypothetical protein